MGHKGDSILKDRGCRRRTADDEGDWAVKWIGSVGWEPGWKVSKTQPFQPYKSGGYFVVREWS
jgi:hypothetical protein